MKKGSILVISGPSGCGKSSLVSEVLKVRDDIYFSISTTTRPMRDGEKEGVNYFYISKEEFEKDIEDGLFLEWAKVHDNYYGTTKKMVLNGLRLNSAMNLSEKFRGEGGGHDIAAGCRIPGEKIDDFLDALDVCIGGQMKNG